MEYDTVTLLELPDSSLTEGLAMDSTGEFTLGAEKPGPYLVKASFVGFRDYTTRIVFEGDAKNIELGNVDLKPAASDIDEVTVTENQYSVNYQIDKEVINVEEAEASFNINRWD